MESEDTKICSLLKKEFDNNDMLFGYYRKVGGLHPFKLFVSSNISTICHFSKVLWLDDDELDYFVKIRFFSYGTKSNETKWKFIFKTYLLSTKVNDI